MFWHRLALALGMPVAEAQRRISSREFSRWIAYDRMRPIGSERMDCYVMLLYGIVHNAHCSEKRDQMDLSEIVDSLWPEQKRENLDPNNARERAENMLREAGLFNG